MRQNCLIVSPVGVGNALLLTPLVHALLDNGFGWNVTCVTWSRGAKEVLERIDGCHVLPPFPSGPEAALVGLLRQRGRFDWGLAGFPCTRLVYRIPLLLSRPRHTAAHLGPQDRTWGISRVLPIEEPLHDVERNLEYLPLLGIPRPKHTPLRFVVRKEEQDQADALLEGLDLQGKTLLGLHPGSSARNRMWMKRWPVERFAELSRIAREELALTPMAFLGPEEGALKEAWLRADPQGILLEVSSVGLAGALLRRCRLLATNDSAYLHLACAMEIPVLAVFGPSPETRTYPWGVPMKVVTHDPGCRTCWSPCTAGKHPACFRKDRACLIGITVEQMAKELQELLEALA